MVDSGAMKSGISATLTRILEDTRREIEEDRARESLKRVKQMVKDAVPVKSFAAALAPGKALIAELKEKSPSQGKMRKENVAEAAQAYKKSPVVKAISVLTSWHNFGEDMRVSMLEAIKNQTGKPVLRKDFMIEEYQVYQARAYGADAILLMANILEKEEMARLSDLAFELGMDVLFETHGPEELDEVPERAKIIGINSRSFEGSFRVARFFRQWLGGKEDRSVNLERFKYAEKLPAGVIKVAESGVTAGNCREVLGIGFQAVLAGTSLLMDERGVAAALGEMEGVMRDA
jgi:indole-3-glycerol phosphate synthase